VRCLRPCTRNDELLHVLCAVENLPPDTDKLQRDALRASPHGQRVSAHVQRRSSLSGCQQTRDRRWNSFCLRFSLHSSPQSNLRLLIKAMFCSPLLFVIQCRWLLCLELCRRRSEGICWTSWAVATPGAEGVGRLPSRSKWGRYRPKFDFLLSPLRYPVAGHLLRFLALPLTANGNLAANPDEKPLGTSARPGSILAPRRNLSVVASKSLNTWQFSRHASEIYIDRLPAI
jgi:hypothetical protein